MPVLFHLSAENLLSSNVKPTRKVQMVLGQILNPREWMNLEEKGQFHALRLEIGRYFR